MSFFSLDAPLIVWIAAVFGGIAYVLFLCFGRRKPGLKTDQWNIELRALKAVAVNYVTGEVITLEEFDNRFGDGIFVLSGAPRMRDDSGPGQSCTAVTAATSPQTASTSPS